MKKLGILVMPLMSVSLLASCGGNKPTEYVTHKFTFHGTNCKINGVSEYSHDIYENDKNVQYTITPNTGFKLPETIDSNIPYDNKTGVITISEIKTDIELSVVANPEPTPGVTYTLTFNCENCKAYDENDEEVTKVSITLISPYTTYLKFCFKGTGLYKRPLKSSISVEKANNNENVDFEYDPLTGEIELPIVDNLIITAQGINKTLKDCTWAEINEISTTGRAEEFFRVGDEKEINLFYTDDSTNTRTKQDFTHTVRIIGFNHDYSELPDDDRELDPNKKLGITFEFVDLITKTSKDAAVTMKWNDGNNYNYRKSTINNFLNDVSDTSSIINMLPRSDDSKHPDLKEVLKPVDKKVGVFSDSSNGYVATSFDGEENPYPYLFLLAYNEMHKPDDKAVTSGEDANMGVYEYYKNNDEDDPEDKAYRVKKIVDGSSGDYYWLRSPATNFQLYAWSVENDGDLNYFSVSDYPWAIAPAFCI